MVTALCVLRLYQDGIVDINENVNRYLSSWKLLPNKYAVTLANLLAHQAGIIDADGSFGQYIEGDAIPRNIDILNGNSAYNNQEVYVKCTPETQFEYSGEPYFMSQGWGIGMQCKLKVYYKKQRGLAVMTNCDPGADQDSALIGEIIQYVTENPL